MLGDIGEAEDVVQEAYSRLARTVDGEIDDDRGWLTVVTSRLCLDQIRSARSRRELTDEDTVADSTTALGHAPPVDPADRVTLDDEVRSALFVMLERLSPAERVAFVLHDVFQTPFEAIADTLGRSAATCRQLARRARQKITSLPLRPNGVTLAEHRAVTEKFIAACTNGDLDGLRAVLHPQVWGTADFSADSPIRPHTQHGADQVAHTVLHYYGPGATLVSHPARSQPALLAFVGGRPFAVITLTVEGGLITKIHVTADPGAFARGMSPPERP